MQRAAEGAGERLVLSPCHTVGLRPRVAPSGSVHVSQVREQLEKGRLPRTVFLTAYICINIVLWAEAYARHASSEKGKARCCWGAVVVVAPLLLFQGTRRRRRAMRAVVVVALSLWLHCCCGAGATWRRVPDVRAVTLAVRRQ